MSRTPFVERKVMQKEGIQKIVGKSIRCRNQEKATKSDENLTMSYPGRLNTHSIVRSAMELGACPDRQKSLKGLIMIGSRYRAGGYLEACLGASIAAPSIRLSPLYARKLGPCSQGVKRSNIKISKRRRMSRKNRENWKEHISN
jgi:hypothetical protein